MTSGHEPPWRRRRRCTRSHRGLCRPGPVRPRRLVVERPAAAVQPGRRSRPQRRPVPGRDRERRPYPVRPRRRARLPDGAGPVEQGPQGGAPSTRGHGGVRRRRPLRADGPLAGARVRPTQAAVGAPQLARRVVVRDDGPPAPRLVRLPALRGQGERAVLSGDEPDARPGAGHMGGAATGCARHPGRALPGAAPRRFGRRRACKRRLLMPPGCRRACRCTWAGATPTYPPCRRDFPGKPSPLS